MPVDQAQEEEMMKHTPGPWFHNRTVTPAKAVWNTRGAGKDGEKEVFICSCSSFNDYQPPEAEIDANMQLIAAAPELLEACRAALQVVDHRDNLTFMECAATLRAAIAKAEAS